jgi:hypothetical protein
MYTKDDNERAFHQYGSLPELESQRLKDKLLACAACVFVSGMILAFL